MQYFVYIITNKRNGTLYIGMTNNLVRRVWEHKEGLVEGFSKKYGTKLLVYYEESNNVSDAIAREKQLKKWKQEWKLRIIEKVNPDWGDLSLNLPL
ncbi:MAG: endonuclease [Melioribacteraceae bacterium]|nr:MAG: endonuclease [Melioribacteraceae bacterium]